MLGRNHNLDAIAVHHLILWGDRLAQPQGVIKLGTASRLHAQPKQGLGLLRLDALDLSDRGWTQLNHGGNHRVNDGVHGKEDLMIIPWGHTVGHQKPPRIEIHWGHVSEH